jgi:hypothetical protein
VTRNFPDWIKAFQDYATFGEAPPKMHFWTAVSTIAGALRRKVWIDQYYFKWFPNFYVIFVAPPGVVAKTTTADVGMDLLRKVPGIKFGPSVVTWQSLVKSFADSKEAFEYPPETKEYQTMAALTISSGEFGNLLNPQDKEMVDMLVSLWDGKGFRKETKHSGSDTVENPWINLIACTTPAWIAGNFPEYMIGGGFTSRSVFVYCDRKEKLVPYPGLSVPKNIQAYQEALVADLIKIADMCGEFKLTREALEWGSGWYEEHNTKRQPHLDDDRFGGYIARKQTHIHKLAMVLAASRSDALTITLEDLQTAAHMVTDLEAEMVKVFSKIGMNDTSVAATRLLEFVKRRRSVSYEEAYRYVHAQFPSFRDFEDVIKGLIKSGHLIFKQNGTSYSLSYAWKKGEIDMETGEIPNA